MIINEEEKNNNLPESFILKEIDLVESCINKMSSNSFEIKKWTIGIVAILAGLLKQNILSHNLIIGSLFLIVIIASWELDAYFTKMEKLYRRKYSWIIKNRLEGDFTNLFDLNPYNSDMMLDEDDKILPIDCVLFSKTLFPFYLALLLFCFIFFIC